MNAALSHLSSSLELDHVDYVAVQDVDRFPSRNASCASAASQYYAFPDTQPRVLHPMSFTGGVLVIRLSQVRTPPPHLDMTHTHTRTHIPVVWTCHAPPIHNQKNPPDFS